MQELLTQMSITGDGTNFLPPSRKLLQLAATRRAGRPVHATDLRTTKFYKTKLCPFMQNRRGGGRCSAGLDCGYAHALEELRVAPNLQRTKWCTKVVNGQTCTDPKCGYAHCAAELQPSTDKQTLKTSLCIFWTRDPKLCLNGSKCRFAHGEDDLRKRPDLSPRKASPLISSSPSVLSCRYAALDGLPFATPPRGPLQHSPELVRSASLLTTLEAENAPPTEDLRSQTTSPERTFREEWPHTVGYHGLGAQPAGPSESPSKIRTIASDTFGPEVSDRHEGLSTKEGRTYDEKLTPASARRISECFISKEQNSRWKVVDSTTTYVADASAGTWCGTLTSGGPGEELSIPAFPLLPSVSAAPSDRQLRGAAYANPGNTGARSLTHELRNIVTLESSTPVPLQSQAFAGVSSWLTHSVSSERGRRENVPTDYSAPSKDVLPPSRITQDDAGKTGETWYENHLEELHQRSITAATQAESGNSQQRSISHNSKGPVSTQSPARHLSEAPPNVRRSGGVFESDGVGRGCSARQSATSMSPFTSARQGGEWNSSLPHGAIPDSYHRSRGQRITPSKSIAQWEGQSPPSLADATLEFILHSEQPTVNTDRACDSCCGSVSSVSRRRTDEKPASTLNALAPPFYPGAAQPFFSAYKKQLQAMTAPRTEFLGHDYPVQDQQRYHPHIERALIDQLARLSLTLENQKEQQRAGDLERVHDKSSDGRLVYLRRTSDTSNRGRESTTPEGNPTVDATALLLVREVLLRIITAPRSTTTPTGSEGDTRATDYSSINHELSGAIRSGCVRTISCSPPELWHRPISHMRDRCIHDGHTFQLLPPAGHHQIDFCSMLPPEHSLPQHSHTSDSCVPHDVVGAITCSNTVPSTTLAPLGLSLPQETKDGPILFPGSSAVTGGHLESPLHAGISGGAPLGSAEAVERGPEPLRADEATIREFLETACRRKDSRLTRVPRHF